MGMAPRNNHMKQSVVQFVLFSKTTLLTTKAAATNPANTPLSARSGSLAVLHLNLGGVTAESNAQTLRLSLLVLLRPQCRDGLLTGRTEAGEII